MFNSRSKINFKLHSTLDDYKSVILKDLKTKLRLITQDEIIHTTDIHSWDMDEIIFTAPLDQRDWVIFPITAKIEAHFITCTAIFTTTLEVVERYFDAEILHYRARLCAPLTKKQQRQSFRVETLSPVQYAHIHNDLLEDSHSTSEHNGTILNLSVGGMCMVCSQPLETDDMLTITFDFLEHSFKFSGTVLSGIEKNSNSTYSHRIKFNSLDTKTIDLLSKLLLEKQRQMLRPTSHPLYTSKA